MNLRSTKKLQSKIVFFIGLLITSNSIFAATQIAKVKRMEFGPMYGDTIYVDMDFDNDTACATNQNYDYAFDSSTAIGAKVFSVLLAAQRSSSSVQISGTGTCTINAEVEDIRWIQSL